MTSLPVTRRDQLLDVLRREGTVRVSDIASVLGVTPVTVRRDITQLANEGLVRRVHGGATLLAAPDGEEETAEFSWFFDFSEDGTQIKGIREFVDTATIARYTAKNEKLRKEKEKEKGSA